MRYPGLSNNRKRRGKYSECATSTVHGIEVRLLTQYEIDEFCAHIARLLNPTIYVKQTFRRSIV